MHGVRVSVAETSAVNPLSLCYSGVSLMLLSGPIPEQLLYLFGPLWYQKHWQTGQSMVMPSQYVLNFWCLLYQWPEWESKTIV